MSINYIHVLCNRNSQFTGLHNMAAATPASAATAIIVEAYYVLSIYIEFNDLYHEEFKERLQFNRPLRSAAFENATGY